MSVIGRPTAYRPEFCELACNYCLLGATNEELAGFFDVAPRTIDNWIARIPEFAAAVLEGRAGADSRVARALHQRAVGYTCTVRRTVLWRGEEKVLTREVHYPPDVRACIFWLRNRRRQDWSDRPRPQPPSDELPDWFELDTAPETRRDDPPLELPLAEADEPSGSRGPAFAEAKPLRLRAGRSCAPMIVSEPEARDPEEPERFTPAPSTPAPFTRERAGHAGCRASCGCGPVPRAAAWCCRPRGPPRPPCPSAPRAGHPSPRTSA